MTTRLDFVTAYQLMRRFGYIPEELKNTTMSDQKSYIGKRAQLLPELTTITTDWPYKVTHQSGLSKAIPVDVPVVHMVASGRAPEHIDRYIAIPVETFEKEWETVID